MTYSILTEPLYPKANEETSIILYSNDTEVTSRFVVSSVPVGSLVATDKIVDSFLPDMGGLYGVKVMHYVSSYTNGQARTVVSGYYDGYVSVAIPVTLNLDILGNRFGIELITAYESGEDSYVTYIKEASIVNTSSALMYNIANTSAVTTKLAEFIGKTIESGLVIPEIKDATQDFVTAYNAHIQVADIHLHIDNDNHIATEVNSIQAVFNTLNEIKDRLALHENNNKNTAIYHGYTLAETGRDVGYSYSKTATTLKSCVDKGSALVLLARLQYLYLQHIAFTSQHSVADLLNTVNVNYALYGLVNEVLNQLEGSSVDIAENWNPGETQLLNNGFVSSNVGRVNTIRWADSITGSTELTGTTSASFQLDSDNDGYVLVSDSDRFVMEDYLGSLAGLQVDHILLGSLGAGFRYSSVLQLSNDGVTWEDIVLGGTDYVTVSEYVTIQDGYVAGDGYKMKVTDRDNTLIGIEALNYYDSQGTEFTGEYTTSNVYEINKESSPGTTGTFIMARDNDDTALGIRINSETLERNTDGDWVEILDKNNIIGA